jgi:hypothetical protein
MSISPFVEYAQFEQGNSEDSFYATGSVAEIGNDPGSFSSALSNKEQIKISFSVETSVQMLSNSSSIYYFNIKDKKWNIPSNALSDHVGPMGNVSIKTDATNGSTYIEDYIGFDYRGNSFVSGNLDIIREEVSFSGRVQKLQTNYGFTSNVLTLSDQSDWMMRDFPKSITRNPDYDASQEETFSLPIDKPFLIEKVVFEVPFCFGDSWFRDMSSINYAYSDGNSLEYTFTLDSSPFTGQKVNLVDQGGPLITLTLLSQKNYGSSSIRDVVGKSLITHISDSQGTQVIATKHRMNNFWYLSPLGIEKGTADTVVDYKTVGINRIFTGSIMCKMSPTVSNGIGVINLNNFTDASPTLEKMLSFANFQISNKFIKLKNYVLSGVDALGRGMSGFSPSGGSIFGGEYVTAKTDVQNIDGDIKNQLFVDDQEKRDQKNSEFETLFSGDVTNTTSALSNPFIGSTKNSPYLVNPSEKFILALSKTRPSFKELKIDINTVANPDAQYKGIGTILSSSYFNDIKNSSGHDVCLNTGSINITFYGSYVRAGNSYVP